MMTIVLFWSISLHFSVSSVFLRCRRPILIRRAWLCLSCTPTFVITVQWGDLLFQDICTHHASLWPLPNFLICFLIPFLRCNNVEASIRYSSTGFKSVVIEKTGLFSSISRTRAFIFLFLTLQQTFFNLLSPVCKYGELKNEAIYDAHDFTKASHEKKRLIFHRFFAFLSRFILASKKMSTYSGT